jgi:peptidoglycan DL-endopeptidase CwlO
VASTRSRALRVVLVPVAALALGLLLFQGAGQASPAPTLAQVKAQLAALQTKAEIAQETLNQAQVDYAAGMRRLTQVDALVAKAKAQVAAAEVDMGRLASAAYRSGGLDQTIQLLLADNPTQFLDEMTTLDGVTRHQGDILRSVSTAQQRLAQDELAASQVAAQLRHLRNVAATNYAAVQAEQAQMQAVYNSLSAAQRAELAREQAAARARSMAQARAASGHRSHGYRGPVPYNGSIGSRVVAYALSKVGDSYVWGASGPNAFDCSGLTMRAYAQVGISLPHSSSAQYGSGRHISTSQLQPGDLVFYYSPIHHVGIYIGGGMIVNAENPGSGVQTAPLMSMPYVGAVRPY